MRIIYTTLGFIFVGLGLVGVALPVLPTTPFLLLASFFLSKGSERFHNWFTSTLLYKKHLESFVTTRSMTLKTKLATLALSSSMMLVAFLSISNVYGRIAIVALVSYMYYYFIFQIKTIK